METVLYEYWRSSASYRVRIALNLLGEKYRSIPVDLLAQEQRSPGYLERNPQGFVPMLEIDGLPLTQSLAIIEYLDETRGAGFLPGDAAGRARVRALAYAIAMDIHPICNQNVASHVVALLGEDAARKSWMQHFISRGLDAFEKMLARGPTGTFCHGDRPTMADLCLVPQLYNARRWGVDISGLHRLLAIDAHCATLPAFAAAHPDRWEPTPQ